MSEGPGEPAASHGALPALAARGVALLLATLGLFPLANALSGGEALPWWSTAVRQWITWAVILGGLALILSTVARRPVAALLAALDRLLLRASPRAFALGVATTATLFALRAGWALFRFQPVTSDEFAQGWQARLMAAGHLSARSEATPEFFSTLMTVDAGHGWLAQFPAGGPAILAVGMLLRVPWLVSPLLTGWTVAVLYLFARQIGDELTARRAAILALASPFVLFMGGSQMNHVPTLAALLTAMLGAVHWSRAADASAARRAALVVGASLGIAATVRPYDAALAALAIGLVQLHLLRERPALWRTLAAQCAAAAVPVLLLLAANWATLGHPLAFGYDVLNGAEHRPGFHLAPTGIPHTVERGAILVSTYLMRLNVDLMGWPAPVLLLVVASLLLTRRFTRWDLLLALLVLTTLAGYFAYWAESYFVGPRFLYAALPAFLIWLARLPAALAERGSTSEESGIRNEGPTGTPLIHNSSSLVPRPRFLFASRLVALLLPLWIVVAWALPANRSHHYGARTLARHYEGKGSTAPLIVAQVKAQALSGALILVADGWHARLAARLRAVGFRPLFAERVVAEVDACALQLALDSLEAAPLSPAERAQGILRSASRYPATPREGQASLDLLAFAPDAPRGPACAREAQALAANGVNFGALLPHEAIEDGALGGAVVYARDMGPRNERLRARFGDRRWYRARVDVINGQPRAVVEPYAPAR